MFKYRLPIFLPLNIFWKMQIEVIYIPPPLPKKRKEYTKNVYKMNVSNKNFWICWREF